MKAVIKVAKSLSESPLIIENGSLNSHLNQPLIREFLIFNFLAKKSFKLTEDFGF